MTSSSFNVHIIDNMLEDGDKMFTITIRLIPTCLPVTINSDTTTVTIIDEECTVILLPAVRSYMLYFFFVYLVFRVQFSSATFSALESAGEILFTIIIISGRTLNVSISVDVSFSEATATG